jgi:hypothetical protein
LAPAVKRHSMLVLSRMRRAPKKMLQPITSTNAAAKRSLTDLSRLPPPRLVASVFRSDSAESIAGLRMYRTPRACHRWRRSGTFAKRQIDAIRCWPISEVASCRLRLAQGWSADRNCSGGVFPVLTDSKKSVVVSS